MKIFKNSKLPIIILIAIVVVFSAMTIIFSAGVTVPGSYYQTGNFSDRNYYTGLVYKVNLEENQELDSIWINLGSLDYDKQEVEGELANKAYIEINVGRSNSEDRDFTYRNDGSSDSEKAPFRVDNTLEGAKIGQWQKLYDYSTPTNYKYYIIATKNAVKINEIVFVGVVKDGGEGGYLGGYVKLSAEAIGAGPQGTQANGTNAWYKNLKDSSNVLDTSDSGIKQANLLINEQKTFKVENIVDGVYTANKDYTQKEYSIVETVRNLSMANAKYLDTSENPLGVALIGIGTSIFGVGSLAVRVVPILFAIGTIILCYIIARKFIKNKYVSLVVPSLVAIGSFFVVYTSVFIYGIGIFFFTLALYFVLRYALENTISSNSFIINLLFGGLSYALSLSVKTFALFTAPILFGAVVYGIVKRYKQSVKVMKNKSKNYLRVNMYREIACAGISFIILPILVLSLCFLVVGSAFSSLYQVQGFFEFASKHFFGVF